MSMSRSMMEELCEYVLHKPSIILGNKFFDCRAALGVEIAHKAEKFEPKLLVLSKFRVFFVVGKSPSSLKIERSFHILSIRGIHIIKENELAIFVDDSQSKKPYTIRYGKQSAHQVALHFLSALKHYFPDIMNQLRTHVDLAPASLYEEFILIQIDAAARPCHSFRRTYAALCDFYDQPYREEVSWDIEKIYTINNVKCLRIDDFSHLLPRDLLPIVGVLMYSSYFTGLSADGVRIPPELIEIILSVVKKSSYLTELKLRNCGLPRDFIHLFANALQQISGTILETVDLSKNALDDKKGFSVFCTVLSKMTSLRYLVLAECGLSDKCVQLLCSGLYNSITSSKSSPLQGLVELNLAEGNIKDEVSPLVNLVSLCNTLRVLDLTNTQFPLDRIWPALKFGGLQMEKLILSGCQGGKKSTDSAHIMKEFFAMAVNLTHISFAGTVLSPELLKAVLLGLASNQQLMPYYLDLEAVCEKGCGPVLESCLSSLRCSGISLRDNGLELDLQGIVRSLLGITTLKKLDIGGNNLIALRRSSKPSHANSLNRLLLDVVKLCSDDSPLEELILSKAQLGSHLSVILNTLGATTSLRSLDISHNEMTNFGARILSKALQLNVSLRHLIIDHNKIGADGFVDIASSMQMNFTLTSIPYPANDLFECKARNEHVRAMTALTQIENALERNRSTDCFEIANSKKGLNGGIQSLIDLGTSTGDLIKSAFHEARYDPTLPPKIEEMVHDFVDQMRQEASIMIQETIARVGDLAHDYVGDAARAERIASERLKELWLRDVKMVVSDWRWRELCDRSEQALRSTSEGRTASLSSASIEGSPCISSPRIHKKSIDAPAHRPRSIIGDLNIPGSPTAEEENGVNLDTPPKLSGLTHLQKARPRRRGGRSNSKEDDNMMNRSCDLTELDEDTKSEDSVLSEPKKPLSERAGYRVAMLPEAALINSSNLRPAAERGLSPREPSSPFSSNFNDNSPPQIPNRNRSGGQGPVPSSPPSLPPKPEPRLRTLVPNPTAPSAPPSEDEQNANNRVSVADMTRIFNR